MNILIQKKKIVEKVQSFESEKNAKADFEILKNDHFGTGRNTALKMH